jgi:PAS domain S-box-containing protein
VPGPALLIGPSGRIVLANAEARRCLARPTGGLEDRTPRELGLTPPVHLDGQDREWRVTTRPIPGESGWHLLVLTRLHAEGDTTARLATFEAVATEGVLFYDRTHILDANEAAHRLLRAPPGSLVGRPVLSQAPPEEQERLAEAWDRADILGIPLRTVAIRDDGTEIQVEMVLQDVPGGGDRRVMTFRDITAQAATEEALRLSEERFRRLSAATFEGILIHDGRHALDWNQRMLELTGRTPEELASMDVVDLVIPEDRPGVRAEIAAGRTRRYEVTGLRPDGTTFPAELEAKATTWEGQPARIVAVRDVSERYQARDALAEREALLDAVTRAAPVGLFRADPHGRIDYVNPTWCTLTGLHPDEAVGTGWLRVVHPRDREAVAEAFDAAVARRHFRAGAYRLFTGSGIRWVWGQVAPVFEADGGVTSFVGTIMDITDRMRATRELEASLREKEVLLQEVHHRVKNNLEIINSLLLLQALEVDDPAVRAAFEAAQGRINAMAGVHRRMYASEDLEHVDLGVYVRDLLAGLQGALGRPQATLVVDIGDEKLALPQAVTVGLLLNELVTNALQHAFPDDRPGTVWITLEHTPDEDGGTTRCLVVEDDGVGADTARSAPASLGSRLVDRLAEQLGGQVRRTTGSRGGLRVEVRFPG